MLGPIEGNPEYLLIVNANNLLVEIDNEIDIIHDFVRLIYRKRFPELEQLVKLPLDYLKIVQELENDIDQAKINGNLQKVLPKPTLMIVSVSAATTQGKTLTNEGLSRMIEACQIAMELNENKQIILSYVDSQMTFIASNLSIIVDLRVKVARLVACKVTLAARIDSFHESPKGEQGRFLLNEIERALKRLQEPPPVKTIKPLPIPIDHGKKETWWKTT
ncbi:unnamed protein product [Rotaria sp. Silwood2]|nr:unnamed protein product [Rotaria sp. Silwood2]CAF3993120.1 unnamed protein product [Rotaria sp. Silwood2]